MECCLERFFPLKHLTIEQLHDLYRDACRVGKRIIEYDRPGEEGCYDIPLAEEVVLRNILPGEDNYLVFHENSEDFPDATIAVFPLKGRPFTTVYIDFDSSHLDWFAKKYGLTEWWQMEGDKEMHYPYHPSMFSGAGGRRDIN
jgi:hypothetical protein